MLTARRGTYRLIVPNSRCTPDERRELQYACVQRLKQQFLQDLQKAHGISQATLEAISDEG